MTTLHDTAELRVAGPGTLHFEHTTDEQVASNEAGSLRVLTAECQPSLAPEMEEVRLQ